MTVFVWAGKVPLILWLLWPVQAIIGRFQKISIPYHRQLFGILRARGGGGGGGGVFELEIQRQGVTYDWNLEQVYSLKMLIFKQLLLDEVFVISGIIKVEVSVISLSLRLRLITLNFLLGRWRQGEWGEGLKYESRPWYNWYGYFLESHIFRHIQNLTTFFSF